MSLWVTKDGLRNALNVLRTSGAHAQTPVFLAMKLAGVNSSTRVPFASNSEMREALFDKYFAMPGRKYYNPFSGTIHNQSYPHGSQYTVAREIRKPRWRETLDWAEPAGRAVTNYDVKFLEGYVDVVKAELFSGQRFPLWPLAVVLQARTGKAPEAVANDTALIEYWSSRLHLTQEEKDRIFDLAPPPGDVHILGPDELTQEQVDEVVSAIARHSNRAISTTSRAAPEIETERVRSPAQHSDLPLNLILYGPPGTGKTREVVDRYIPMFCDEDGTERYVFTTFHPSYFYEDFVEGLRPVLSEGVGASDIKYAVVDGVFKIICEAAQSDPEQPYAIFIDEINRGKIDALFGDLITLIDEDKRSHVFVTLPYSKDRFSVPSNLHIIGTMNTADRSIALLDVALRRRFDFLEIAPDEDALRSMLEASGSPGGVVDGVNIPAVLRSINQRLEALVGRDRMIGHGWWVGVNSLDSLKACFNRKIMPLLLEYFHDDYERVADLLRDDQESDDSFFTRLQIEFSTGSAVAGDSILRVRSSKNWTASTFTRIYEDSSGHAGD